MRKHRSFSPSSAAGFTLLELITVIVISGIIAGMIAVFIVSPVTAYLDTARRAELTENADTAIRRIARDLRTALPNSIRVVAVGSVTYLEFIPTVGGGRYRQYPTAGGGGNSLDFSNADTAFDVLGPAPVYSAGNSLVLFNLGSGSASDAYAGNNRSALSSSNAVSGLFSSDATPHTLVFAAKQFPAPSPSARFQVVQTPVTYACVPNPAVSASGVLNRYAGYAFAAAQPQPPGVTPQLQVGNVAECDFDYNEVVNSGAHTRTGLVTLRLRLEQQGESARLVHQMQVVNAP
ncbi:MAG: type II secretion system protein [Betaproteobacteria bacterium]